MHRSPVAQLRTNQQLVIAPSRIHDAFLQKEFDFLMMKRPFLNPTLRHPPARRQFHIESRGCLEPEALSGHQPMLLMHATLKPQ